MRGWSSPPPVRRRRAVASPHRCRRCRRCTSPQSPPSMSPPHLPRKMAYASVQGPACMVDTHDSLSTVQTYSTGASEETSPGREAWSELATQAIMLSLTRRAAGVCFTQLARRTVAAPSTATTSFLPSPSVRRQRPETGMRPSARSEHGVRTAPRGPPPTSTLTHRDGCSYDPVEANGVWV